MRDHRSRADPARGSTLWAQGHDIDTARQHALERWRERLLAEPDALDALAAEYPRLDRPRLRVAGRATRSDERARGGAAARVTANCFAQLKAAVAMRAG